MFAQLAAAFRKHPIAVPALAAGAAFLGARLARPDGCVPSTLGTLLGTVGVVGVGVAGMGVASGIAARGVDQLDIRTPAGSRAELLRVLRGNPSGLSTPAKVGIGALVVGGGVLAYRGTAGAQSLSGGSTAGAAIGDAFRALAVGDVVLLPGAFHLRASAVATPPAGTPELPAQVVRVTGPAVTSVTRGPREALYPVVVVGTGAAGFAFIPADSTRTSRVTGMLRATG